MAPLESTNSSHASAADGMPPMDSADSIRAPSCAPCNWSEGVFASFDEYDYEDVEYEDSDAAREYGSAFGSDVDEEDEMPGSTWRIVDEDMGSPEDIVVNAVVRHVAVPVSVYSHYYNSMVKTAAQRNWSLANLPALLGNKLRRQGRQKQQTPVDELQQHVNHSVAGSDVGLSDNESDIFMAKNDEPSEESTDDKPRNKVSSWKEFSILGIPIMPPDHVLAMTWSVIMLLVDSVYSSFLVPLSVAFCFHPEKSKSWCATTEYIAGPIFIMNVFLGFHTGFVISCNLRRMYLMKSDLISKFYIRHGGFWLDMLGVVAFVIQIFILIISENTVARVVVRLLLIMRIIRVYKLITIMLVASVSASSGKEVSTIMSSFGLYLLTLLFTAAFFINFFACLFYMIADIEGLEKSWLGRYHSAFGPASNPPQEILEAGWLRHWQLGIYYVTTTMMTVGYGDITPATIAEQIVAIIMMLTAVCLFAVLISSMSEALNSLTADARSGAVVRKKLGEVLQWMEDRDVGHKDRKRIMGYYSSVWRLHHKEHETESEIFAELPNVLRAKVAKSLVKQLLSKSIVLPSRKDPNKIVHWNLHPAHVDMLAERFVPVEVMPGHELFAEGDDADSVYLLEEGRLEVWQHQSLLYVYENPRRVGFNEDGSTKLEPRPQWIGNSSILGFFDIPQARKRPMRIRAQVTTKLWRIELESLKPVMRTQVEFVKLLIRIYRYNMVEALRNEAAGVAPRQARTSISKQPSVEAQEQSTHGGTQREVIPHEWTEFHAFMRPQSWDVEAENKLMNYRKWADQLEKAKTRQVVKIMGKIFAESPIANEVNYLLDAESAASDSIGQISLEQTGVAFKAAPARPPAGSIKNFSNLVTAASAAAHLATISRAGSASQLQSDASASSVDLDKSN